MDDAKLQLAEKLKTSNNVLVTVSRNPSVDQLSALLGLTLLLNKQGKHAAAVYSGETPSTIEFLQPEATIEKNTDSLRDFIIALDKNKADKLRYKVEDDVVRIFITPYKTSINQDDFEFSEGDFNVDVVVALGVQQQEDLDEAITAHGRILHDATVTSINVSNEGGLGSINWHQSQASSLSELITELIEQLGPDLLDEQIATALLTGIVSETDRFRNEKTSSATMSASATLMNAGANQQLVATKLEELEVEKPAETSDADLETPPVNDDGTIQIEHNEPYVPEPDKAESALPDEPEPVAGDSSLEVAETPESSESSDPLNSLSPGSKLVTEPPSLGGTLTANSSAPTTLDPSTDPFSTPIDESTPMLNHNNDTVVDAMADSDAATPSEQPPAWVPPAAAPLDLNTDADPPTSTSDDTASDTDDAADAGDHTLTELEESVNSPHVDSMPLDAARDEVDKALNNPTLSDVPTPPPIDALNAQPLGEELHPDASDTPTLDANAPPPVPPPIPFQFGTGGDTTA